MTLKGTFIHTVAVLLGAFLVLGLFLNAEDTASAATDGNFRPGVSFDSGNVSSGGNTDPECENEDGNIDGKPCWWEDPDTGDAYYVTSENYR